MTVGKLNRGKEKIGNESDGKPDGGSRISHELITNFTRIELGLRNDTNLISVIARSVYNQ